MNIPVTISLAMLYFITFYSFYQEGLSMATIIAAIFAFVGTLLSVIFTHIRGRKDEENEHNNLSKEHSSLSERYDKLSEEHNSILEAQKEHTSYLASLTEKNQETLQHLSDESIRMSEMQKQVKERGVDTEKMIANIQALVQMNTDQSQQLRQMTEERNSLLMEKDRLLSENISLRVQRDQLESQLKQKEREERNRQVQEWDDLEW